MYVDLSLASHKSKNVKESDRIDEEVNSLETQNKTLKSQTEKFRLAVHGLSDQLSNLSTSHRNVTLRLEEASASERVFKSKWNEGVDIQNGLRARVEELDQHVEEVEEKLRGVDKDFKGFKVETEAKEKKMRANIDAERGELSASFDMERRGFEVKCENAEMNYKSAAEKLEHVLKTQRGPEEWVKLYEAYLLMYLGAGT
jgi:chromosome segregation ATPase